MQPALDQNARQEEDDNKAPSRRRADAERAGQPAIVLALGHAEPVSHALVRALQEAGFEVVATPAVAEGPRLAAEFGPDVVVLALRPQWQRSRGVIRALRGAPATAGVPVLVSGVVNHRDWTDLLADGANDFVRDPLDAQELIARVRTTIETRQERLRLQAERDRLTHLLAVTTRPDPDTIVAAVADLLAGARTSGRDVSLLAVRIHVDRPGVDRHLPRAVRALHPALRIGDQLGRDGTNTLLIAAADTGAVSAARLRDRLLAAARSGGTIDLPLSIGLATALPGETAAQLIARAHVALRSAPLA